MFPPPCRYRGFNQDFLPKMRPAAILFTRPSIGNTKKSARSHAVLFLPALGRLMLVWHSRGPRQTRFLVCWGGQPGSPADPVFVQCRDILYILYRDILYSFWFGGGGLEGMITILPLSIGLLFWHDRLGWRSASGLCWRATRPGITSRRLIEAIKWGVACAAPHCIDRFPHAQKNSKLAFS
jgi:hypothetical protein